MNMSRVVFCTMLSIVIGGCSSQSAGWKSSGENLGNRSDKKVVAYKADDFEKEGIRLCPFGFDIIGPVQAFKEGRENIRYIRCRMMQR